MRAWALEFVNKTGMRRIFCTLGNTRNEAVALALDELEERLLDKANIEKYGEEEVKDYSLTMWTDVECPTGNLSTSPSDLQRNSSFAREITK